MGSTVNALICQQAPSGRQGNAVRAGGGRTAGQHGPACRQPKGQSEKLRGCLSRSLALFNHVLV